MEKEFTKVEKKTREKNKMKIKKPKKEDFDEIAKILIKESSRKPYNEKYNFKTAKKEILQLSKNELYVAENEGEIIGFIASNIVSEDTVDQLGIMDVMYKPLGRATLVRMVRKYLDDAVRKRQKQKGPASGNGDPASSLRR